MFARLRPHLPALLLAGVMGMIWSLRDWHALSTLRLPDTDDAMRLQQVRDWIAGQGFADVSQHRLAGGLAMHWSRIGDLVPAALILLFRPFTSQHAAEVAAVIAWPIAQFAVLLALVGSIAARFDIRARTAAVILAGLAYPATTLFMPGRIDHHGLQVILVLIQVRALLSVPDWRSGTIAGAAIAIGAAIGLETIPFALVTGAIVAVHGRQRQCAFGLSLAGALALLLPIAGTGGVCDTIAPLALPAISGALAMAATGYFRWRLPVLALACGVIVVAFRNGITPCLSGPYAAVDPLVARLWLARVAEAQPLLAAPTAQAIGYGGLVLVGSALTATLAWRRRGDWIVLLVMAVTSLAIALAQLRGVYVGAALAAVPIAVLLTDARAAGQIARVLGLWIAGAGFLYPIAASAFARDTESGDIGPFCTSPQTLAAIAAQPPGTLMAPIDIGPYAIAATRLEVIAAPYHRNNAGNAAMYRFFLSPPEASLPIARAWHTTYVAFCPGDFGEIDATVNYPHSVAARLQQGRPPSWLRPVPLHDAQLRFYRIVE